MREYINDFHGIKKYYDKYCKSKLKDYNFSPNETLILKCLVKNPEVNISREISGKVNVSPSLISRSVDTLNRKGLILNNQDYQDRRRNIISLNIDNKLRDILNTMDDDFTKKMFRGVPESDIRTFNKVIEMVLENLNIDTK